MFLNVSALDVSKHFYASSGAMRAFARSMFEGVCAISHGKLNRVMALHKSACALHNKHSRTPS
jgi:hypothetical protein